MRRGMRDTIRRKPNYDSDSDWDIFEALEKKKKDHKEKRHDFIDDIEEEESKDRFADVD